jgi:hypothetical protein
MTIYSSAALSDSSPAPTSDVPEVIVSGSSGAAIGTGGITEGLAFAAVFFPPLRPAVFLVARFADFFVPRFFAPLFFVDFFADFLVDFLAVPFPFDFDALFLVPFPPRLRAPLAFLPPFLVAIVRSFCCGLCFGSP